VGLPGLMFMLMLMMAKPQGNSDLEKSNTTLDCFCREVA